MLLLLGALGLLSGCTQTPKLPNVLFLSDKETVDKQDSKQDSKIPEVPAYSPQNEKPIEVSLTPEQEQQIGLRLETAKLEPFDASLELTGRVQAAADELTHIAPPVPGRVTTVFAKLGQQVTRGQTLALIKSDTVGQLESDLLAATLQNQADIKQAEVQLKFSQAAFEREEKLFNDKISAKADLETARTQYEKDKANLQALQSKLQSTITVAEERLSLSGVALGVASQVVRTGEIYPYVIISAPRNGIVISRTINMGELADPSKELFNIADLSRVWLVADTYEKDVNKVHIGEPVQLTLDSLPNKNFRGQINYVANALDPQTRTLTVKADIPNPGLYLKPDMFARLKVMVNNTQLLSVPNTAIQRTGDHSYIFIQTSQHRYEERQVELGTDNGKFTQITRGLNPGEKVVVFGALALQGTALKTGI